MTKENTCSSCIHFNSGDKTCRVAEPVAYGTKHESVWPVITGPQLDYCYSHRNADEEAEEKAIWTTEYRTDSVSDNCFVCARCRKQSPVFNTYAELTTWLSIVGITGGLCVSCVAAMRSEYKNYPYGRPDKKPAAVTYPEKKDQKDELAQLDDTTQG